MNMKIKSFYADSMDVALQSASKEMGEEALILNTREAPSEFRHFGKYEVVCAVAEEPAVAIAPEPMPRSMAHPSSRRSLIGDVRVAFFVGPTGSGKSSTCAKIAIQSKFTQNSNPLVLSWDTGRVGGGEALRSYCEIAGIPFHELDTAPQLTELLSRNTEHDLILIDTAALEGGDASAESLEDAISRCPKAEVHLVLSGTYSNSYLQSCQRTYSRLNPGFLLPTHLDESQMELTAPGVLALSRLTIRWCGTGRAVPEDLQDAGTVLQQVAALSEATPAVPQYSVSLIESAVTPAHSAQSAKSAIESILARFRRQELTESPEGQRNSKSSAA
jgi:flagellar biosynthesis GTPase FlhF